MGRMIDLYEDGKWITAELTAPDIAHMIDHLIWNKTLWYNDLSERLDILALCMMARGNEALLDKLTTAEAAETLGITARSVARLIKQGVITAEKRGRDYLIPAAEVERYASERRPAHRPKRANSKTTINLSERR